MLYLSMAGLRRIGVALCINQTVDELIKSCVASTLPRNSVRVQVEVKRISGHLYVDRVVTVTTCILMTYIDILSLSDIAVT